MTSIGSAPQHVTRSLMWYRGDTYVLGFIQGLADPATPTVDLADGAVLLQWLGTDPMNSYPVHLIALVPHNHVGV